MDPAVTQSSSGEPGSRGNRRRLPWLLAFGLPLVLLVGWQASLRVAELMDRTPRGRVRLLERAVHSRPRDTRSRLELAAELQAAGQPFPAVEQLEVARALGQERDEQLCLQLAELYNAIGDPLTATETLAAAFKGGPPSPMLCTRVANMGVRVGDFRLAAAAERARHTATPDDGNRARLARMLLLAGDWEGAAALFDPKSRDADMLTVRGAHALLRGQPAEAARLLADAVKEGPGDAWSTYLLAVARELNGDLKEAVSTFQQAASLPETPIRSKIGAGRLMARLGRLDVARTVLDGIADEGREDPYFWQAYALLDGDRAAARELHLGRAAYQAGDPWAAETHYRRGLSLKPDTEEARNLYGALISSTEARFDSPLALRYAEEATRRWPKEAYFLRRLAELLLEGNRYDEARDTALRCQAVAAPDEKRQVTDLLARIALESGDQAALEKSVAEVRSLDPRAAGPELLLGEWHQQRMAGDHAVQALDAYRRAATTDEKHAEAWARLGSLLAEQKRFDDAVPALLRALSLQPRIMDGVPHVHLGQIYRRRGKVLEAEFHERRYRELRRLKDEFAGGVTAMRETRPAPEYRAFGETCLGRYESWLALCAFTRATRLDPKDAQAWLGLAAAARRMGRIEEAISSMRRAHLLTGTSEDPVVK